MGGPSDGYRMAYVQKGYVQLFSWATIAPLSNTISIEWENGDDAFDFTDIHIFTKWHTRQKRDLS